MCGYIKAIRGLFYNHMCSKKMSDIGNYSMDDYTISTLRFSNIYKLKNEYREVFGTPMPTSLFLLILINRKKTCFVLTKKGEIIAVNFFYFHRNEFDNGYIHSAFMFVKPRYQGQGIGGKFKSKVLDLLKQQSIIKGIYTRISVENVKSLSIQKRYMFEVISSYIDMQSGEKCHYMLLKF